MVSTPGFAIKVVLLLGWLPSKAKEVRLHCYLPIAVGEEIDLCFIQVH